MTQTWFEKWANNTLYQKLYHHNHLGGDVNDAKGISAANEFISKLQASPPLKVHATQSVPSAHPSTLPAFNPSQVVSASMLPGLDILSPVDTYLLEPLLEYMTPHLSVFFSTGAPSAAALDAMRGVPLEFSLFTAITDTSLYQGTCLFVWPTHTKEFFAQFGFIFGHFKDALAADTALVKVRPALHAHRYPHRVLNCAVPKQRGS
jgi:hypothetical protein